jgi:hypothetical protein
MMIISFAWTTPAVVLGIKNTTRRDWTSDYFDRMVNAMNRGERLQAYDKSPRSGGKCFGTLKHVSMKLELTSNVPDIDWYNEGFDVLTQLRQKTGNVTPHEIWEDWKNDHTMVMVTVRFTDVQLNEYGIELQNIWKKKLDEMHTAVGAYLITDEQHNKLKNDPNWIELPKPKMGNL